MDHQVLLQQLGGRRFIAMTGAKDFIAKGDTLMFRIGSGALNKINKVTITLDPSDTYTMTFYQMKKQDGVPTAITVETVDNVYAENIQSVFTRVTGMHTRL